MPAKSLVLYADDDPDDLALLKDAFHDYSNVIDLMTFQDGVELLRYVEQLSDFEPDPCLIILDINMPCKNGIEVLKEIRRKKETADVPVVLFSTSTLPSEAATARRLNAGFVNKPIIASQIRQIIDQLLDHCHEEVKQRISRK